MPNRSATPGRKPSRTTSAFAQSAPPSPGSRSRSQTTDSLPALRASSQPGATSRRGSPSGVSTRTTRAPSRMSSRLANGPGRYRVKSTTSKPRSTTSTKLTTLRPLTERSTGQEDKRRLILDAAVRVFAAKGFHASRVGDIATEAGVAHGLLYHYFRSKEEVLETIFRETWTTLVRETVRIESSGAPFREQLRRFARIYLGSWLVTPELVRVLVREVARSPEVGRRVAEINELFQTLARMIAAGQQRG